MRHSFVVVLILLVTLPSVSKEPQVAYDIEMAQEICDSLPLEKLEGLWLYPDDKVTVMVLKDPDSGNRNDFSVYNIMVVDTSDACLHPGEIIGKLYATAQEKEYRIELSTERKNDLLMKPKSCIATINNEGDCLLIKKQKAPLKGRLNFNFSRLLPGFWKLVSLGVSQNNNNSLESKAGMVKVYPSYDGNGSSRRRVRYL